MAKRIKKKTAKKRKTNKAFIGLRGNVISRSSRVKSIFHRKGG